MALSCRTCVLRHPPLSICCLDHKAVPRTSPCDCRAATKDLVAKVGDDLERLRREWQGMQIGELAAGVSYLQVGMHYLAPFVDELERRAREGE